MKNVNVTPETHESVKNVDTKDTGIRVLGVVLESLPGNLFHVKLEENDLQSCGVPCWEVDAAQNLGASRGPGYP